MMWNQIFDLAGRQFIQLSIVIAVAAVITRFLRNRVHLVYLVWVAVLIKALTPPIWSSPTGIFSWAGERSVAAGATLEHVKAAHSTNVAYVMAEPDVPAHEVFVQSSWNVSQIVLVIWMVGCAVVLLGVAVRGWMLWRRISASSIVISHELLEVVESLRKSLRIRAPVRLVVCNEVIGPAVFGIFRPMVVLPKIIFEDPKPGQLRALLTHELMHIRRRDPWIAGLQVLAQAVWWFHPLVWWMNGRIGQIREMCCDAEVIGTIQCRREDYAQMLVDILKQRRRFRPMLISLGVSPAQVTTRRLHQVLNGQGWAPRRLPLIYWMALGVCGLLIWPGAGLRWQSSNAATVGSALPSTQPTTQPSTQPSLAMFPEFERRITVMVGVDSITLNGEPVGQDELTGLLEAAPDRGNTVLELGYDSDDVPMGDFMAVQRRINNERMRARLGFKTIRLIGPTPRLVPRLPPAPAVARPPSQSVPPEKHRAKLPTTEPALQLATRPENLPPLPLPALPQAPLSELTHAVAFQLGQSNLEGGDRINIAEVRGTASEIKVGETYQVRGTYHLESQDFATLAVYVTATRKEDASQDTLPSQSIDVPRGDGEFVVSIRTPCEGHLHVSFYSRGQLVGGVYFGTGNSVLRDNQ